MIIDSLENAEKINRVLFRISNSINITKDLNQLYASIHNVLGQIIDVNNFFIALYDSEKRTLRFPYYRDEKDKDFGDLIVDYDVSDSLTGQVIIEQTPVLLGKERLAERKADNRIRGSVPLTWLGVPLINDNKVIGVMAVQSYTKSDIYNEMDAEILEAVSGQIALAIDRKQSQEALVASERRFREIADLLPTILCELNEDLNVTYINRIGIDVFSITPARLKSGFNIQHLFHPGNREPVSILLNDILEGKRVEGVEYRLRKIAQKEMVALIYSSPILRAGGIAGARMIITDITLRKKTEEQRDKLISDLKKSLAEVKILKGILPICASCKKIRDDKGYWNQVESYIHDHTDAEFSHSICPECVKKLYPDFDLNDRD